ncbi:hypothetical protein EBZ80_08015 [bacterium]|nr:hypothetical protein [bacterium]
MGFSKLKAGNNPRADESPTQPDNIPSASPGHAGKKRRSRPEDHGAFIKSSIAVHDRSQLETVFDYPLLPRKHFARQNLRYQVEAYIFFPRQMGINPGTYPKERFYGDLRPLIRLREPRLTFGQLIGDEASEGRSPVKIIAKYLQETGEDRRSIPEREVLAEARIFACALAGYYLRRVERRSKKIRKAVKRLLRERTDPCLGEVELACLDTAQFLDRIHAIMRTWRRLMEHAGQIDRDGQDHVHRELKVVDEYCTYRIRDGLTKLSKTLGTLQKKEKIPQLDGLERKLAAYARFDHWYSIRKSYGWITRASDDLTVERYVFRRGVLKRRVWQVLYLDVRTRPLFTFQQQLGAMVAAGVAAFWAVSTEILIRIKASAQPNSPLNSLGSGTTVIVVALILAYVLKDRIKELGRSYFRSSLLRSIPDNSERILYTNSAGERWVLGSISEFTRFVHPDRLPSEIRGLRGNFDPEGLMSEEDAGEAIHYRKLIDLNANILRSHTYPLRAVHDILRLNIEAFLGKLDDPLHGTEMLDTEGRLVELKMPKVYHLDLILKYSQIGRVTGPERSTFESIRLVINKKGLFRIERIEG